VPRAQRVRRFEANLIAIKRLWTEEKVQMKAAHFELDDASCLPKPFATPASADLDRRQRRPGGRARGAAWRLLVHRARGEIPALERQMELYGAPSTPRQPFPNRVAHAREVFVAKTREEAIRLVRAYLGANTRPSLLASGHAADDSGLGQDHQPDRRSIPDRLPR